MQRRLDWMLLIVMSLSLLPGPLLGQQRSPSPALNQFLLELRKEAPSPRVKKPSGLEKSVSCQATCGAGASPWAVSVSCSGTCTAVDQNCDGGVQGYVECNGVRQECQPCVRCIASSSACPDGYVQCEGWTCDDFGGILCNVMCDGYHYFCPGHFGEEICE